MNEKKSNILNIIKENFVTIISCSIIFQFAILMFYKKSGFISMIFSFLLLCIPIVLFIVFKEGLSDKVKKFSFNMSKLSVLLWMYSLIMNMGNALMSKMPKGKEKTVVIFILFGFMLMTLIYLALITNENVRKYLDLFYDKDLKIMPGAKNEQEIKGGDVKLCIEKDTGDTQILKNKDRFLHMLILGPTGSGKTSQVILPMIWQDMQNPNCGITVIEPKADLAEKVYFMAQEYNRDCIYFNPIMPNCPYFNPLIGREEEVIENMAMTFNSFSADSSQFFKDNNEILLRNSLKVLKRLRGDETNFIELARLINMRDYGIKLINEFEKLPAINEDIMSENKDIAAYFRNDYFAEKSKTFEFTSAIRTQISKINSNKYLRKVLNPERAEDSINFVKHLDSNGIVAIATAQGELRDLGTYLGYFIILQFQSAVFKRPGDENTRRPHFLYIDEFQKYSNPAFADMLTQGRSYRVASHLATQNRALIGMNSGRQARDFISLVSTNARNVIIYPGANSDDAEYYSKEFGEQMVIETSKSKSKQSFNLLYGFKAMNYPTESTMEKETLKARFSASDIIYRPFGEITYRIICNNTVQVPKVGTIEYIPRELNEKLDAEIEKFRAEWVAIEEAEESKDNNVGNAYEQEPMNIPVSQSVQQQRPKPTQNRDYIERAQEYKESVVDDIDIVNINQNKNNNSKQPTKRPPTMEELDVMDELL